MSVEVFGSIRRRLLDGHVAAGHISPTLQARDGHDAQHARTHARPPAARVSAAHHPASLARAKHGSLCRRTDHHIAAASCASPSVIDLGRTSRLSPSDHSPLVWRPRQPPLISTARNGGGLHDSRYHPVATLPSAHSSAASSLPAALANEAFGVRRYAETPEGV